MAGIKARTVREIYANMERYGAGIHLDPEKVLTLSDTDRVVLEALQAELYSVLIYVEDCVNKAEALDSNKVLRTKHQQEIQSLLSEANRIMKS